MSPTFYFLLAGIAGFVFHSLIKLKSLSDDAHAANVPFNWYEDYIVKDIFGILLSFTSPFIWLLIFKEIATQYPKIETFAITSFFVMGVMGSYVLQLILGKAKKSIRKVVDEKTNELDKLKQE